MESVSDTKDACLKREVQYTGCLSVVSMVSEQAGMMTSGRKITFPASLFVLHSMGGGMRYMFSVHFK